MSSAEREVNRQSKFENRGSDIIVRAPVEGHRNGELVSPEVVPRAQATGFSSRLVFGTQLPSIHPVAL